MDPKKLMPGAKYVGEKRPAGKTQTAPGTKSLRKEPPADKKPLATKKPPSLPTFDELLHKVLHLVGAVAMGAISIKEANLMLKALKIVLDALLKRSGSATPLHEEAALSDACRRHPELTNALLPFLTNEQVKNLMQETSDAPEERADDDE